MSREKTSSSQVAWSLLTEGVTEARVNLHRIRLMCDRAMGMIDESEARDHLYQVAGDMIQALPSALDEAEGSLDRTSYALAVMGEDFLKGRISISDRERVDNSLRTAPFSSRDKSSAPQRVAQRYLARPLPGRVASRFLLAQAKVEGVAPSAEFYFFHNPETHEVRQFAESDAISNKPGVAVNSVKDSDSPDRTIPEAKAEVRESPPSPSAIEKEPGGKEFSTLNRFIIQTEQPGVTGVPQSRDELPKHPKLTAARK